MWNLYHIVRDTFKIIHAFTKLVSNSDFNISFKYNTIEQSVLAMKDQ